MSKAQSSSEQPWRDEQTLRELYWDEGLSQYEIAHELCCKRGAVDYWMDEYDIETRGYGGIFTEAPWQDEERLRELYWDKQMTQEEIGDELGCTKETVGNWMDRFGIETRGGGRQFSLTREEVEELYVYQNMSREAVAEELDIGLSALKEFMGRKGVAECEYEIELREGEQ